jgi:hypothetical protein
MKTQDDLLKEMVCGYLMVDKHPWRLPKPMPRGKIEGFETEFRWVRDYVTGPIAQAYVSVAEVELIDIHLHYIEREYEYGYEKFQEEIFLLNESGNLITAISTQTVWHRKYWGLGSKIPKQQTVRFDGKVSGGTIRDALSILGDKSQFVRIILSYWEYTQAVIIYKLPKGVSIAELLKQKVEFERTLFRKVFDEI